MKRKSLFLILAALTVGIAVTCAVLITYFTIYLVNLIHTRWIDSFFTVDRLIVCIVICAALLSAAVFATVTCIKTALRSTMNKQEIMP